ncbi:resistance-nodulation-cell division efflux transporter [Methylobacterium haplocladii]|uniref:Resistance-nodulation-cell division (RND) efflux transporter n=1 Tax=Methylobacterium haplocladii TaxID=1176176 RepID=A0A512IVC0_9HYPH|nr:resistance-nodulation-cell division (RND) efflux transporter [Methylobacterium haplocladii]GJD85784.1 Multidrug export protein AcrF [Methylobacterium haplocladii]GLS60611.1 resistance-nodulation-cell division efflux transporter [Methylobacterium haplocladii]
MSDTPPGAPETSVNSFNLSDWALRHRSLVWFLMLVCLAAGVMSYSRLGREEDPPFAIKTMVVQAKWPGATIKDTLDQVTDRIEKELQQINALDYVRSYTTPGQATVFVQFKDTTRKEEIQPAFYQVRKRLGDIKYTFPEGVEGPSFNDEFGDVYGNVYAFTGDGLTHRQLRDYVEGVRTEILKVPDIGKTLLMGTQGETVYLDFSTRKLAGFGIDIQALIKALQSQNAVAASGVVQAGPERVSLRVSGQFTSEDSLKNVNLRFNDRFFRLADVAEIHRGYEDPPAAMFRVNGEPAIGLAIAMRPNANLLKFGENLKERMRKIEAKLPIGVGLHLVSDQPKIVEEAVGGFTQALVEAVVIVLFVSFVSLGLRAGFVVAISIPLVLAIVFVVMQVMGVTLQRISLGALIIALGLLVDDAMITVEMMVARLELGDSLKKAATFAYTSTAFPMLTGTLVTIAGFLPIGFNGSSAGEYTYSLFVVIAAALSVSWVVAVLFAPLLGVTLLPKTMKHHAEKRGLFTRAFLAVLTVAMRLRWITVVICVGLMGAAVFGMTHVQQQFFPSSDRSEVLVDLTLPQNATIAETKAQMDRFEAKLKGDPDIVRWSSYVGQGAVRFYLPLDQQLANAFYGQAVIVTKSLEIRDRVVKRLQEIGRRDFVGIDVMVQALNLGPPVGRPIQYRLSGPDIQEVRRLALGLADVVAADKRVAYPTFDWNEPGKVLRVEILQDKARQLGVTSQDIAGILNGVVGGQAITQVRDSIYLVNVVGRAQTIERISLETLQSLQVALSNGSVVPVLAFAKIDYDLEQPIVWRRDRVPTLTVRATIKDTTQPPTIVAALEPGIDAFVKALPEGYTLATGGAVEEAGKGQGPIAAVVPVMLLAMATLLMVQLQSFQKLFLVFSVAPLGLIGVVPALLLFDKPMGFVAILGILALIGIIIRNALILVSQIEESEAEGLAPWDAVIEATRHRMRPILLTAAAASLGLIPIAREVFWGPMAYAMIGGILAATLLTLLFLPALYVGWYRIKPPARAAA